MKKILIILIAVLSIVSCKKEVIDHVRLSGNLQGLEANDTLMKINSRTYSKEVKIGANGNFEDTLHIDKSDFYSIVIGRRTRFAPFLATGNDLEISCDVKDVTNTLVFKGKGEETNNYLTTRRKEVQEFTEKFDSMTRLDSLEFYSKLNAFEEKMDSYLNNKKIDTSVVSKERMGLKGFIENVNKQYKKLQAINSVFEKGKESPKFNNLENFAGGTSSLDDFNGKYVFIDVWATWCKPCIAQIPALKELEKEYEGKNIVFISISMDKPEKHDAWSTMIKEKAMSGIQLFSGTDQSFMQAYQISSIPRFIFLDPDGKIINSNTPLPTNKEVIREMFTEAGL